ncbi:MAG: protein kinase, partial [Myxococcota bacterium]
MRLGPFDLGARAGEGASATVWYAVHADAGVPVAVKVLHGRYANDLRLRRAFDAEIRALAGLEHRAVATILDFGEVGRDEAVAAGGAVPVGAPWFAMERASGGTLRVADADELRTALAEVLEALAHAHARGVLHRDLKPANLLVRTAADARPGLMVADWGIVHLLDRPPSDGTSSAGTAWFAAPEQVDGQWRAFGPWTDLYALGATAWALATGRPPRAGRLDLSAARFPLDPALVEWIRRLLSPEPADRFMSAADARAALPGAPPSRVGRWPPVPPLLAASLPLFPLRRPGLVGRSDARRRLAGVVRAVALSRRARVALLVGPPGAGRSAVIDGWLERMDV